MINLDKLMVSTKELVESSISSTGLFGKEGTNLLCRLGRLIPTLVNRSKGWFSTYIYGSSCNSTHMHLFATLNTSCGALSIYRNPQKDLGTKDINAYLAESMG